MSKSRPFSIRIDEDLLKVINQHTSVNRNAYIENLILRGLMLDLNDTIEKMDIKNQQLIMENDSNKIALSQVNAALAFIQEIVFKLALKQGFNEQDLKKIFQAAHAKYNQN